MTDVAPSTSVAEGTGPAAQTAWSGMSTAAAAQPEPQPAAQLAAEHIIPAVTAPNGSTEPQNASQSVPQSAAVKLYVAGVPKIFTAEQLQPYFAQFGPVESTVILVEKGGSGVSRGCAFVTFADQAAAHAAIEALDDKLMLPGGPYNMRVRLAKRPGVDPPPPSTFESEADARRLFFTRGPPGVSSDTIIAAFSPLGEIEEVNLFPDRATGSTKGCGFVTFRSKEHAQSAMEMLQGQLKLQGHERPMVITWADPARRLQLKKRALGMAGPELERELFFAKVPRAATEADVTKLFAQYGHVEQLTLFKATGADHHKGCGLVTMSQHQPAADAIAALDSSYTWPTFQDPMVVKWMDRSLQKPKRMDGTFISQPPAAAAQKRQRLSAGNFNAVPLSGGHHEGGYGAAAAAHLEKRMWAAGPGPSQYGAGGSGYGGGGYQSSGGGYSTAPQPNYAPVAPDSYRGQEYSGSGYGNTGHGTPGAAGYPSQPQEAPCCGAQAHGMQPPPAAQPQQQWAPQSCNDGYRFDDGYGNLADWGAGRQQAGWGSAAPPSQQHDYQPPPRQTYSAPTPMYSSVPRQQHHQPHHHQQQQQQHYAAPAQPAGHSNSGTPLMGIDDLATSLQMTDRKYAAARLGQAAAAPQQQPLLPYSQPTAYSVPAASLHHLTNSIAPPVEAHRPADSYPAAAYSSTSNGGYSGADSSAYQNSYQASAPPQQAAAPGTYESYYQQPF